MLALDTEDDSDGQVIIINFYDGIRHESFVGDDCQWAAWHYIMMQAPEKVWACNLEYDLINVFGAWLGKMCTLQYVRSGILRGTMRDAQITFYDTLRHWPMSVEAMGTYLGLPKMQKDFRNVAYCRRDTEIVWRFVAEMTGRYEALHLRMKATLPSMALQLWRGMTGTQTGTTPRHAREYFRDGYYGGRVEVYRFGEIRGRINHYDVNSLFPYVMREHKYPALESRRVTTHPDWSKEGMATVTLVLPETNYPCLPVRTTTGAIYPYGALHGTWPYPEIRQALQDGAVVHTVHKAIEFRRGGYRPFLAFVEFCWSRRRAATHDLDRVFWKLMMNSLYGKFGQMDGLTMIYQDREYQRETAAGHVNVIWSAYVTSYARLVLLRYLRGCRTVYYTDTDSLFTPDELPVSAELGALKQEGQYAVCEFAGKKIYHADFVAKAKGVPKDVAADFIRTGKASYRKPARFRESRRSFMRANVWYEVEKYLTAEQKSRIIQGDGTTRPWRLDEWERAHPEESVGVPALWEH